MADEKIKSDVQVGLMSGVMDLKLRSKALHNQCIKFNCFDKESLEAFEFIMNNLHSLEVYICDNFKENLEVQNESKD